MQPHFPKISAIREALAGRKAITRFAPSPTGYLHLGHVVNALHVWGIARALDADVILRMEDHDRTRCKPEYEAAILDDLQWLGLLPDQGLPAEFRAGKCPYRQTDREERYAQRAEEIKAALYLCDCSRQSIRQRTQQADGEDLLYDGFCRMRDPEGRTGSTRLRIPEGEVVFQDLICGLQTQIPAQQCGDFPIRERNGNWTYQFAVVVDDLDQGVNLVVRGQDILASTGRQILLQRILGQETPPVYVHHGLLVDGEGRKLSKCDFAADIHQLHLGGMKAEALIGQAAFAAGWMKTDAPMGLDEMLGLISEWMRG